MMAMMNDYACRSFLVLICVSLFAYELLSALMTFYEAEVVTATTLEAQENHQRPWICFSSKYLMRQSQTNEVKRGKTEGRRSNNIPLDIRERADSRRLSDWMVEPSPG